MALPFPYRTTNEVDVLQSAEEHYKNAFNLLHDVEHDRWWTLTRYDATNHYHLVEFLRAEERHPCVVEFPTNIECSSFMALHESGSMVMSFCKETLDVQTRVGSWQLAVFAFGTEGVGHASRVGSAQLHRGNDWFWDSVIYAVGKDFNGVGWDYRSGTLFDIAFDAQSSAVSIVSPSAIAVCEPIRACTALAIDQPRQRLIILCRAKLLLPCMRPHPTLHSVPLVMVSLGDRRDCAAVRRLCLDPLGRVYLVDNHKRCVVVIGPDTRCLGGVKRWSSARDIKFDSNRGELVVLGVDNTVVSYHANSVVPHMLEWTPVRHRYAPAPIERMILSTLGAWHAEADSMVSLVSEAMLHAVFALL